VQNASDWADTQNFKFFGTGNAFHTSMKGNQTDFYFGVAANILLQRTYCGKASAVQRRSGP
jgi:hypothetical protein